MVMLAGGPVEGKGELNVCMPSGFTADVEPPMQSVAGVERSTYKATWHEATKVELDGHKNDRHLRNRDTAERVQTCRR